jgi:hypothetical protein
MRVSQNGYGLGSRISRLGEFLEGFAGMGRRKFQPRGMIMANDGREDKGQGYG